MDEAPDRKVALFTEALEQPARDRAAFLEHACGGNAALRLEVEALLHAHALGGDFLEPPVRTVSGDSPVPPPVLKGPGDRIGRYQLIEQIGEGGCGVVFLAAQEEPVRRRVALKIIKPGMDTRSVIARFESERQALALMEHPNIARVLDAGATDAGRPFFVMEWVRGVRITEFCDGCRLSLGQRLELFVQVCHAVQHAHQKGILHRDIKPSNILVTTTADGKPVPKVIDFGIAKATTGRRLTDKTLVTAMELLIGTPAYMSPEQFALDGTDLDTRTDIYSLGVLLHELLAGVTPFDMGALLKSGFDEVRRVVLTRDPVRPSTRLGLMPSSGLTAAAQCRRVEGSRLIRMIRGDLDWITLKCLEKDRTRRYETADGLARDILRHLASEPVSAGPPGTLYRLGKLVRRNRLLVAGLAIIGTLLIASLTVVTVLLAREQGARREADLARRQAEADKQTAQSEAAKSLQVTAFLRDMLAGAGPAVALGRDTSLLREILDRTAARIATELAHQPAVEADLSLTIGSVYEDLGAHESAERMFRRVLELNRGVTPDDHPDWGMLLNRLGLSLLYQQKLDEAEQRIESALAVWKVRHHEDSVEAALALENLAMVRLHQNRLAEAESLMRRVLALRGRLLPVGDPDLLNALNNLANIVFTAKRYPEAEQIYREVLDAKRRHLGVDHFSLAVTFQNLGVTLTEQGKAAEAREHLTQAVQLRRRTLGEDHPNFLTSLGSLADLHRLTGNPADAEVLYRETLTRERRQMEPRHPRVLRTLGFLAAVLAAQKKHGELDLLLGEYLTEDFIREPRSVPLLKMRLELLARAGRWSDAARDAVRVRELEPGEHLNYHTLAPLLVAAGDLDAYRRLCAEILSRFGGTRDMFVADRMAKDCLIHPASGVDGNRVTALADIAVAAGKEQPAFPFFQFCKALAAYRQGHFALAEEQARQPSGSSFPLVVVEADAVLAMARHRLQRTRDAQSSLARATRVFDTQLPALDGGDLGGDWRDWIIARALLDEARSLVGGPAAAGHLATP